MDRLNGQIAYLFSFSPRQFSAKTNKTKISRPFFFSLSLSLAFASSHVAARRRRARALAPRVLEHQEITRVILCRLILNDIIMFSKIVWHFYVTNFENYVVLFLIRHNNKLLMLLICHRIFEQHNNVTTCDYIISLNKFNNITHSMIFSLQILHLSGDRHSQCRISPLEMSTPFLFTSLSHFHVIP